MRIQSNSSRCWAPALGWRKPIISTLCIVIAAMVTLVASAQQPFPAPPQVYIDTTWNPPTQGGTWTVTSSSTLQLALNRAQPGDTIVLNNSAVYSGNFTLPAKVNPNNQWIYIESSALANLPPPGTRVSPTDAPNMAKIVTPNGSPALNPSPGANHYRLVGLEVTTTSNQGCLPNYNPPTNCFTYELFGQADGGMNHQGNLPDSITFDRVYMHGSDTYDVREAIQGNVTNLAVIDSYISDIHQSTMDSQAIAVYLNPGPVKIVNNFLSATTEDVMFGGAGGSDNLYIPSDIEIRRNHFFKPTAWDSCGAGGTLAAGELQPNGIPCPAGLGYQWVEKNNLEFKSARRVVVTGNIFENTWVSAQVGYSVLFTVRTGQSGNIAVVDDIEVASNILKNVDRGFNTLEQDDQCGPPSYPNCTNPGESKRIWVHNNLVLLSNNPDVGVAQHNWVRIDGGSSRLGKVGLTDYVFQHDTALMMDGSKMWNYMFSTNQSGCPPTTSSSHNLWMLDNVIARQPIGDCGYQGTTGLGYYMGDPSPLAPRYLGNVMFVPSGDPIATWPLHNYATTVPFTYVDPGSGNYQLLSPNWTDTSDGQLSGIDWNALQAALGDPAVTIVTTSLPAGISGVAYSATLAATGGTTPYSWSITAGSLPTGVSLGSSTGIISGTPTAQGTFGFTVTVADSASPPNVASAGLSITITQGPQPQTITFPNPGTQVYGVAPITLTATASSGLPVTYSVISGPATVSGSVLTITGAGTVTVEANQAGNANWLPAPPVDDTFTVNKAALSVTANDASMTYGDTLPTFTASYSGFVNNDGQGVLSGSPSLTTTATSGSPVGPYTITAAQGTLSAANYTFVFVNGTLTINQKNAWVTANAASKTYGSSDPTLTGTLTGFLPADNVTATYTRTAGETVVGSPYTISATLDPSGVLSNYTITYNTAQFTINPAVLTVTANNASMTYGGALPAFTASYIGFVNGDGQGVLSGSPSLTTTATSSSPVGAYTITATQGTLAAANYTFTFVNGNLTINQAVLTVTANNASIPDGSPLPTFTASYTGFVNGDGIGVLSGSPSLTTTAPQNPPVGTYPIYAAQGTLSAQNYSFSFVSGTLTVTALTAQITSPADGSTLTGRTATFTWTRESGAGSYQLWVGNTPGAHDIGSFGTTRLSVTVTNLPTDGRQIYATLNGYANGHWTVQDTATYTAATMLQAAITSPAKGSTLTGSTATFTWTAETGATAYQLWVGNAAGAHDIASLGTGGLSVTIINLPTDGRQLYVTLYGYVAGAWSVQDSATYTAATILKAAITSPTKGSRLTGSTVTFTWTAETGATSYQLWVGNTTGAHDIGSFGSTRLLVTATGLPMDGRQLYVTLYGYVNGFWSVQDTATYTASQ